MQVEWLPRVIFFDLDDALIHEDAVDDAVMVETVRRLVPAAEVAPEALARSVRAAANEWWQQSGEYTYCRRIGTSAVEGLWGDYPGDAPPLVTLRRFIAEGRYRERVWEAALSDFGVADPALAAEAAVAYARERRQRHVPFPDALATIRRLSETFRLGLITNGDSAMQRAKLQGSGLEPYFPESLVIVSGDLGIGKPALEIYATALARAGVTASEALMVGDNPTNDVVGAQNAGLRAVYVVRPHRVLPPEVQPFQIISELAELYPGL
jgi:putative hydrolase of the HAD superfamily